MKVLIIRLSSFGDILQGLSIPSVISKKTPEAEIHWVVRQDFKDLLIHNPEIQKVWDFDKKQGLLGWLKLCWLLRKQNFTHVYDAHSNLRSRILCLVFRLFSFPHSYRLLRRSKERWKRFLLFKFGINHFPKPYRGQLSFLKPLKAWEFNPQVSTEPQLFFSEEVHQSVQKRLPLNNQNLPLVALAPSAAWEMKRWPVSYWQELVQNNPDVFFILLGGPDDHFCQEIADVAPERTLNLAGKLKLLESCAVLSYVSQLISADTGLLHAADLLGVNCLALIGPTAFGYPSAPKSQVIEVDLPCKPCSKDGRGRCKQEVYQKCMVDIKVDFVSQKMKEGLNG